MVREDFGELPFPETIQHWFVITREPDGEAPSRIKLAWLGMPLPVRYSLPPERQAAPVEAAGYLSGEPYMVQDAICITCFDGLFQLARYGLDEAAVYWQRVADPFGFVFERHEGEVYHASMANEAELAAEYAHIRVV